MRRVEILLFRDDFEYYRRISLSFRHDQIYKPLVLNQLNNIPSSKSPVQPVQSQPHR